VSEVFEGNKLGRTYQPNRRIHQCDQSEDSYGLEGDEGQEELKRRKKRVRTH
jgi:hypothetical protein